MLFLGCAFTICSLLASLAITCSKYSERNTAAWPLPVAQSQARFLCGTSPTRKSNSDLGYLGLELAYSLDLLENRSLNCPGSKVTVILVKKNFWQGGRNKSIMHSIKSVFSHESMNYSIWLEKKHTISTRTPSQRLISLS